MYLTKTEEDWAEKELETIGYANPVAIFPFSVAKSRTIPHKTLREWLGPKKENYLIKNCPGWKLKSNKIYHDSKNKTIHYDHAQIQLFNIPVFYLPYFSHPDPSVSKRSGLLMPSIQSDNQLGNTLSLPFFLKMSLKFHLLLFLSQ